MNETNLWRYQNTSINHIIFNPFSALFLDMGLGKTVSTLTAIKKLIYDYMEVSRVLVIAPKRVAESVWSQEVAKWSHLKGLTLSLVAGTEKQRKTALKQKADIYLLGRDNVSWLVGQYGGSMLPFDMLIIDESSSFKNHGSLRFKALKGVQPSFDRVVLLTGTPAPNNLIELWPQLYLLDRGERLGKTITGFRNEYFRPGASNGHIVYNYKPLERSEQRIYNKINDICISMKAEDYLDMPELIINDIKVELSPAVFKQYKDFEKEQVLALFADTEDGQEISAVNAAALSNKLLQFANGAVYDEERNVHQVHDAKLEALAEILEQGQNVLIAWTYKHDRDRILAKFKKYAPRQLSTDADILAWNKGELKILMMHPASGGHGLNLQSGGSIVVWFGQTWSLEMYQQFNARLYRQGQKSTAVVINRIISDKTIDLKVISSLSRKDKGQRGLLDAVKAIINEYITN